MLNLPPSVRIHLCTRPADLRRSFDGLAQLVEEYLGSDPLSGHIFVFRNKVGDRVKLLVWDGDGYVIYYLEEGTFASPRRRRTRPVWRSGRPTCSCSWTAWTWPACGGGSVTSGWRRRTDCRSTSL